MEKVVARMQQGWALCLEHHPFLTTYALLQQHGCGGGDPSEPVNRGTINALLKRRIIKVNPDDIRLHTTVYILNPSRDDCTP